MLGDESHVCPQYLSFPHRHPLLSNTARSAAHRRRTPNISPTTRKPQSCSIEAEGVRISKNVVPIWQDFPYGFRDTSRHVPESFTAFLSAVADGNSCDLRVYGITQITEDQLADLLDIAVHTPDGKPVFYNANFENVTFTGEAGFGGAIFKGWVNFEGAKFKGWGQYWSQHAGP